MATSLKDKKELAAAAQTLGRSQELIVDPAGTLFIPIHWETGEHSPLPPATERVWEPLEADDLMALARTDHNILFLNESEFRSFTFMTRQSSRHAGATADRILLRTKSGLQALDSNGAMTPHDGSFAPNYVQAMLNEDKKTKDELFAVISEWVGGDEQAESLLSHLATALAPGYSAVKYIILLGEGRNGKGTLLAMLEKLFGRRNISNVTRQMMSEGSQGVFDLSHKLLNIVFDGRMDYIKDSGTEKTLIAGEPVAIRRLYETSNRSVQTNALFVEALNLEPKVRDKSTALQKRLVRFNFPNVYAQDHAFLDKMLSDEMQGALLSLLVDRYVPRSELADRLKPTAASLALQAEQLWLGNAVLQFIGHVTETNPGYLLKLQNGEVWVPDFIAAFTPWMQGQGMAERTDADVVIMLKDCFEMQWKTKRVGGKPTTLRRIIAIREATLQALELLKGAPEDDVDEAVGEGSADEILSELSE